MKIVGILVMIVGATLITISGAFFYNYIQDLLVAGASGSSSIANSLSTYNGTAASPIFVTLSMYGLALMIVGGFFIVGAEITQQAAIGRQGPWPNPPTLATPSAMRACTKCGSFLYQASPYCPNCGNPTTKPSPPIIPGSIPQTPG